jgi:hypothetical protein
MLYYLDGNSNVRNSKILMNQPKNENEKPKLGNLLS